MTDFRLYRLAFIPTVVAVIVTAFSLEPIPRPLEPVPTTAEFEPARAMAATRRLLEVAPSRLPGSEGDAAAADFVAERFAEVDAATLSEQRFEGPDGEGERRNVILTLPGSSTGALLVVASRDSQRVPAATSSGAATGVLLELAAQLGASERARTLILASTASAGDGAVGVRRLLETLPEAEQLDAAIVISQPGARERRQPFLVTSSAAAGSASAGLFETAQEVLAASLGERSERPGAFGELARLALPAGIGEQAVLIARDVDAIALSSAGEAPLASSAEGADALSVESLDGIGRVALRLLATLDAAPAAPDHGPQSYIHLAGNLVPGWALALLALALIAPAGTLAIAELARGSRAGERVADALRWSAGWALPGVAALAALLILSLVGLVPDPAFPFDPARFATGASELAALATLVLAGLATWWALGLRRTPAEATRQTLAAAAGSVAAAACLVTWLANPYLALLVTPLAHVWVAQARARRASLPLCAAAIVVAAAPLGAALAELAGALEWGRDAPWQLVLLVSGGQFGVVGSGAVAAALGAACAVLLTGSAPGRRPATRRRRSGSLPDRNPVGDLAAPPPGSV